MRKHLLILFALLGFSMTIVHAQAVNTIYGKDVVISTRDTSSAELTIKNSTRTVQGYLKNASGTGKTMFAFPAWSEILNKPSNFNTTYALSNDVKDSIQARQRNFVVNVKDFGAIPGDGSNDATAIRNAINYAYNNGYSTVFFPPGVYTSTEDSIGIRSGIRYLGYNATIQQATSNTCIFLAYPNAVSNVTFEGLTLLGKGTDYNGTDSYTPFRPVGIAIGSIDTSRNVKIINCIIRNFAYSGVSIAYSKDLWIENNKFVGYPNIATDDIKNFGIDINNGNRRVTVIGNHIDSVAQGILVQGNVWEYSLIGNVITNVIGQHGIYVSSGWNSVISGNSIKKCANNGILVQLTSGQLRGIDNLKISDNVIDSATNYGIYVYRISGTDLLKNISITGNVINGKISNLGAAIELSYCEKGIVSNNITKGYTYSLLMKSDKYVNVSNHIGYDSYESGLYIIADTSRHLTFDNVKFFNPSRGGSNAFGISASGGSNFTFNNVYVSDSTSTMAYSFYMQPSVDQATVKVTNSTFLNAPVRFESSKSISEYSSNIAASYYNSPSSITVSRLTVNGNAPDKSNAITLSVPTISGTTNTITKFTSSSTIGNSGITDDGTIVSLGYTDNRFIGNYYSTSYQNGLLFNANNRSTGLISKSGDATDYIWFGTAGGTERMRIVNGGNIGINTTSPSYKLDVNGSIGGTSFVKSGGTSSQYLMADGSTTTSYTQPISSIKTSTYTISSTDYHVLVSGAGGAFTVTLPTAVGITGRIYIITRTDVGNSGGSVTLAANGSETIGGYPTFAFGNQTFQYCLGVQSDGTNWQIISR